MSDLPHGEANQSVPEEWNAELETAFQRIVLEFQSEDVTIRRFVVENLALLEVFAVLAALLAIAPLLRQSLLESVLSFGLLTMIILVFTEIRSGFPLGIAIPLSRKERAYYDARKIGTHLRYGKIKTFSLLLDIFVLTLAIGAFLRYPTFSLIYLSLFLILAGLSISYPDQVLKQFPPDYLGMLRGKWSRKSSLGVVMEAAGFGVFVYASTGYVPKLGSYPSLKQILIFSSIFVPFILLHEVFIGRQLENESRARKKELLELLWTHYAGDHQNPHRNTIESPMSAKEQAHTDGRDSHYWRDRAEGK